MIMNVNVYVADDSHLPYAESVCHELYRSSLGDKIGIAQRSPEYIRDKIRGGKETAINGQGPKIEEEDIEALIKKLEGLTKDDVLVISGAIPSTLPKAKPIK